MKRRDAIKTAIGSVLAFGAASFVAKATGTTSTIIDYGSDPAIFDDAPGTVQVWKPENIFQQTPEGWAMADGVDNAKSRGGTGNDWMEMVTDEWEDRGYCIIERLRDKS